MEPEVFDLVGNSLYSGPCAKRTCEGTTVQELYWSANAPSESLFQKPGPDLEIMASADQAWDSGSNNHRIYNSPNPIQHFIHPYKMLLQSLKLVKGDVQEWLWVGPSIPPAVYTWG